MSDIARLCVVQYPMRAIDGFDAFARGCARYVGTAAEYGADFVVFPELLTTQLFTALPLDEPAAMARALDRFTEPYLDLFTGLAVRHGIDIVGGTHLLVEDGVLRNVAFLFLRDGSVERQVKIHPTPHEVEVWGVAGGNGVRVFDTGRGRVAILICYDAEFPELARIAAHKGAEIVFVPYNTDLRSGHLRVAYCAHARAIENHFYMALSGACGAMPLGEATEFYYARSAILTPSDIGFPPDGIAAQCDPGVDGVAFQDVDLALLRRHKTAGSVRNWRDRRRDLYAVHYDDGAETLDV